MFPATSQFDIPPQKRFLRVQSEPSQEVVCWRSDLEPEQREIKSWRSNLEPFQEETNSWRYHSEPLVSRGPKLIFPGKKSVLEVQTSGLTIWKSGRNHLNQLSHMISPDFYPGIG